LQEPAILAAYDAALVLSRRMLEAATSGMWDDLIELEKKRVALFVEIESGAIADLSDSGIQKRLAATIQQILESDRQTKVLTEAWMDEVNGILHSLGAERKLQQAYDTR
jgi:flagellar protein FliT